MFGMSSEEFWEQSPQLYWAYRLFYLKKLNVERENQKYMCWLQGNVNCTALSIAINNSFSNEKMDYPKYEDMFGSEEQKEKQKETPKKEKENKINLKVQEEFNSWARF